MTSAEVGGRVGLSASTLRTWERRYGLQLGERGQGRPGGWRRYSEADVELLRHVVHLIQTGVQPRLAITLAQRRRRDEGDAGFPAADLNDVTIDLRAADRTDPLTGLLTRQAFIARIAAARAHGALAIVDIDGFAVFDEAFGTDTGDAALVELARRFARMDDQVLVGRLGGDEFGLFAPGLTTADESMGLGAAVAEQVTRPFVTSGRPARLSVSIGVAVGDGTTAASDVVCQALIALTDAKRDGGGQVRTAPLAMRDRALVRARVVGSVLAALDERRVHAHFQPIVDLAESRLVAVEALARVADGHLGLLTADQFLPDAGLAGLTPAISYAVASRACRAAASWDRLGVLEEGVRVHVNANAALLARPDYPARLGALLASSGLDATRLTIEISLSALPNDVVPRLASMLAEVSAMGVRLELDGFGATASPLDLLRLRFDGVKLDRQLTIAIAEDERHRRVGRSLVSCALDLGMTVTALGVERDEQADALAEIGCQRGQGWLWSPPLPSEEFTARTLLHAHPGAAGAPTAIIPAAPTTLAAASEGRSA